MPKKQDFPFKESYKNTDKTIVALSVYNTGRQKCTPGYPWGPGVRDHFLIHYIISGQGYYEADGQRYTLNAGDIFTAFPGVPITYYAHEANPWEYCWVGFNGSDALAILSAAGISRKHPVIHKFPKGSLFMERLGAIYESRGMGFYHTVEMTGKLYAALALLLENAKDAKTPSDGFDYVQKAVEYIHGHYVYPISIEEIAADTGLSRSQLYRIFLKHTGKSPKEYLTDFRIAQACRLLKNTQLPITTIAGSVGFDNSLYFSKVFHKIHGVSPSAYRQATPAGDGRGAGDSK